MKIIVLGATGQIGSVLYNGLKGIYEVIGTTRNASDELITFNPFKDDWKVLGTHDVLINCVGQIHATGTSTFEHIHVELTRQIIRHREEIGYPKVIQISALFASPHHKIEFLRTKGIADDLLLQHPDTAVIRPSIVCTPGTMLIKKMNMLSWLGRILFGIVPVPKGFLQTRIQPIMAQDLVELVEQLCYCYRQHTGIVNAGGPQVVSFREIISVMEKSRQESLNLIEVSRRLSNKLVSCVSLTLPKIINQQQYALLFQDNIDTEKDAEQILGKPLTPIMPFFENEFSNAAD